MTDRRLRRSAIAAALTAALALAAAAPAGAQGTLGLLDAWRSAQGADALFRAAKYELEQSRYLVPIARSQLLPSLSVTTSDSKVNGSRDISGGPDGTTHVPLAYISRSRALTLRVPVVNMDGLARLEQGYAQGVFAEQVFRARTKDLALRLGRAYFELLYALDSQMLAQASIDTYKEAVAYATRRFRGGEGTRTDVAEAESRLDLAQAELIEANDQVEVARRALQYIVGRDTAGVQLPAGDVRAEPLEPATLDAWLARAEDRSPEVGARRQAVEVARLEVRRQRAGHYPRVDLVGALSRAQNDTLNTLNSKISQSSIGIQMNLPLYSGGFVTASTDQAFAALRRAEQDLEAELNTQRIEVRRQFLAASNGRARLDAFGRAVASSETALESTRGGLRAGLRTNLDVLDAQRQVFLARRELAQARYAYLQSLLQLRAVAGEPLDDAIESVERHLRANDFRIRAARLGM